MIIINWSIDDSILLCTAYIDICGWNLLYTLSFYIYTIHHNRICFERQLLYSLRIIILFIAIPYLNVVLTCCAYSWWWSPAIMVTVIFHSYHFTSFTDSSSLNRITIVYFFHVLDHHYPQVSIMNYSWWMWTVDYPSLVYVSLFFFKNSISPLSNLMVNLYCLLVCCKLYPHFYGVFIIFIIQIYSLIIYVSTFPSLSMQNWFELITFSTYSLTNLVICFNCVLSYVRRSSGYVYLPFTSHDLLPAQCKDFVLEKVIYFSIR